MEVTGVTPAAHQERSKMAGEYHRANALLTSAPRTFICAWANWSGSLQLVFHAFMLVCVSVCVCLLYSSIFFTRMHTHTHSHTLTHTHTHTLTHSLIYPSTHTHTHSLIYP